MTQSSWLSVALDRMTPVVRVTVLAVDGSAPRDVGSGLSVQAGGFDGTIGGGALEYAALHEAGVLLAADGKKPWARSVQAFPLGPVLEQCCGGFVELLFEYFGDFELSVLRDQTTDATLGAACFVRPVECGLAPHVIVSRQSGDDLPAHVLTVVRQISRGERDRKASALAIAGGARFFIEPLVIEKADVFVYGAGHCGRALVQALAPLPFVVTWVDVSKQRFPDIVPTGVRQIAADDMLMIAASAPANASHIVMTFSHAMDEALVRVLLQSGRAGYVGVIGSMTKAARVRQRLLRSGLGALAVAKLVCPIGLPGLRGKEPAVIAASVAADLLSRRAAVADVGNRFTTGHAQPHKA